MGCLRPKINLPNGAETNPGLGDRLDVARTRKTAPYGLPIVESCVTCPLKKERFFCHLSPPTLKNLDAISFAASYPRGAVLFVEGQEPCGVFVICHGRVKLTVNSAHGRSLILRIVEPGQVVGLPGTMSGKP